ncbi:MAG: tetratricopeptide repeat protein [Hyphomicrobiales bacterium]|nr:tetratricopeptide repeat protein [Hyphomicrobiales bacterium]
MADRSRMDFHGLVAAALEHHGSGRFAEAETGYRAALARSPGHPAVTHNLGAALAAQGRQQEAIACFERAIAADPGYVSAHYNRAVALMALGAQDAATAGFEQACRLEPAHYEAHRALGFLWLAQGKLGRSLDHFARTYDLRRGEDRTPIARRSLTTTTRSKLRHDAEQFRYLSSRLRDGRRFERLAAQYETVAHALADGLVTLSPAQIAALGDDYNTLIHSRSAPQLEGPAVPGRPDRQTLVATFRAEGVVAFDGLLTPPALAALRRFLLESTIWHDFNHIGGFVASYLEDGLACPLLLQIVDELRRALPEVLGEHPLSQAWAFKGLDPDAAVDAHVDDAAVSVNFWVVPDEANLRPGHGGMRVCRVPPPKDFAITDYETDRLRAVTFLEQKADDCVVVPYAANRAVLFRSRLVHASDAPKFAEGYENHRINVTLLFGG